MIVKFGGLKEDKSEKEHMQALKGLAVQITNLTSSYKLKEITLKVEGAECFHCAQNVNRLVGQLYIANHRAEFKGQQLRNILKVDQATFDKQNNETVHEKTFI